MVNIEYKESQSSLILSVVGHAGSGEYGKDIICASCSMLCYMLGQAVMNMHAEGKLKKKPRVEIKEGKAKIVAKAKEDFEFELSHAFYMACVGFSLLDANYPEFVSFKPLTGIPDKEIDKDKKESLA